MITVRPPERSPLPLQQRLRDAQLHVQRYGAFRGESRRDAICALASLTPAEEDFADRQGWLPDND